MPACSRADLSSLKTLGWYLVMTDVGSGTAGAGILGGGEVGTSTLTPTTLCSLPTGTCAGRTVAALTTSAWMPTWP